MWNHHWWDYSGTLDFIEIGVNDIADNIKIKGIEVEHNRLKKVVKMRRVVEIIKHIREDRYFDIVENEMGRGSDSPNFEFVPCDDKPGFFEMVDLGTEEEQEFKDRYFERIRELEESEWNELWDILKGQDYETFDKEKKFDEQFDGSGLRGWWD